MVQSKIIVIGGNHHNTLGVLRSIGYSENKSILFLVESDNSGKTYVSRSKYIDKCYTFSTYKRAVNYLIENKMQFFGAVIICTSDGASSEVDKNFNSLNDIYKIPNAGGEGIITHYMNKEIMAKTALDIGFQVPCTWVHIQGEPMYENIIYPCIVKPLMSIEGSKNDIAICNSEFELAQYLDDNTHCKKIQIQKYIEKDFEYQLIGCSFNAGGYVIIPGVSCVIRPSECSNTGFLKYDFLDNSYPINLCQKFIKKVRYSGLFSMEFLRDKHGNDFFMEINFRNDGNAICVTAAGVNLPYLWYLSNSNQPISPSLKQMTKSVYVMPEFDDFIMVLKRKLSFTTWVTDVKRTDCFMEYDKTDKHPFYLKLRLFILFLLKKSFRLK